MDVQKEGYGIDRKVHGDIYYVPETVEINLNAQTVFLAQSQRAVLSAA